MAQLSIRRPRRRSTLPGRPVPRPAKARARARARAARWRPGRIGGWLLYLLIVLVTLFPFYWILRTSIATNRDLFTGSQAFLPPEPTLFNFRRVLGLATAEQARAAGGTGAELQFWLYLRNSVIFATLVTIGQVTSCAMAAYAFARLRWRGRDAVFYLFLSSLLVPPIFIIIPNFLFLNQLGLLDTFAGLVAPYFFMTPFMVFFLRQFFLGISRDLEDAATLDGAGHIRTFLQICVPVMAAPLATASILAYLMAWNEYMWPLVAGYDSNVRVLTVGLSVFKSSVPQTAPDWTGLMAATVLAALPVIALFLLLGRRIVDSIRFSGLK